MKIIASTGNGYIVEMTGGEIAAAAGFSGTYDSGWEALNKGKRDPVVGTEIKVAAAYSYHNKVLQHQKEAASAANTLRALADLIGGALPDVVIPPPEEGIFDNEAWIVWNGVDEKPDLDDDTLVEIQTRDGRAEKGRVHRLWWKHTTPEDSNFNSDIIRYRVKGGAV